MPATPALFTTLRLAPPEVLVERRADGSTILRSPQSVQPPVRVIGEWLRHWALQRPEQTFLAERVQGRWQRLGYAQALDQVRCAAQGLLDRGLGPDRPLMILSDNSIDHAVLALAAMHIGVPVAPISPAYSLMTQDHAKLRHIAALLEPGLVHASDPGRYGPALEAIGQRSISLQELCSQPAGAEVDRLHDRTGPDTVAKILFTSGSTGMAKGVINTQRMLTANQQQSAQVWQFVRDEPPVVVDWLPWNHTFGGNYNFNLVLSAGGSLYIDGGKPVPSLVETTVANLREVAPTMYFNVPRGFDLLLPFLEQDEALRKHFFSRCRFVFYAGAALPQNLWERFEQLALRERKGEMLLVSAWGATETAPLVTAVYGSVERAGLIGLPVPGCEIKLVPAAGKLEARVRGPNVTPGYFARPDLTAAAFDEEGFYRIGDALKFVDPERPQAGLVFDGRVAEDFKLRTGTWVHVGALRIRLIAAADPLVQDAVITGHDRDEVGALLFLNPVTTKSLAPDELARRLTQALRALNATAGAGTSMQVRRVRIQTDPPRLDAGEITDKGYLNQRAVLEQRASEVAALHADAPGTLVMG